MKEEFMKRIDARNNEKNNEKNRNEYDVASYPFGAEEMLLHTELKNLKNLNNDSSDLEK